MKRALFELNEISRRLKFLGNNAIEQSQRRGDDWDFLCDGVIDAEKSLKYVLVKLTGKKNP
jgi:hypothetical protein